MRHLPVHTFQKQAWNGLNNFYPLTKTSHWPQLATSEANGPMLTQADPNSPNLNPFAVQGFVSQARSTLTGWLRDIKLRAMSMHHFNVYVVQLGCARAYSKNLYWEIGLPLQKRFPCTKTPQTEDPSPLGGLKLIQRASVHFSFS